MTTQVTRRFTRLLTTLSILGVLASLALATKTKADGVLLGPNGRYVPETQQHAFIEWDAGQERLYVATRFAATSEPLLWILPIPSLPEDIVAEPVDTIPQIEAEEPAVDQARLVLEDTANVAFNLDLFPLSIVFPFGRSAKATFDSVPIKPNVQVHGHVEKHGMIVETLTATSTAALDEYLQQKGIHARVTDLTSLGSYLGRRCSLVCGWSTATAETFEARAIRIDFPSPAPFYPLVATSAYDLPIESSIYVRGFYRLQAGCNVAARCQCVVALLTDEVNRSYHKLKPNRRYTRVWLPPSPKDWTDDLRLEPDDSPAVEFADWLIANRGGMIGGLNGSLGVLLGLLLPLGVVPRDRRRLTDYLWGALVGAALIYTLMAAAFVFYNWLGLALAQRDPRTRQPWRDALRGWLPRILLPTATLVAAASLAIATFQKWTGPSIVFVFLTMVGFFALLVYRLTVFIDRSEEPAIALRNNGGWRWLFVFAGVHCAIVFAICRALDSWLAQY